MCILPLVEEQVTGKSEDHGQGIPVRSVCNLRDIIRSQEDADVSAENHRQLQLYVNKETRAQSTPLRAVNTGTKQDEKMYGLKR